MDFKELAAFGIGMPHTGTPIRRTRGYDGQVANEEADTAVHKAKLQIATKLPRPLRLLACLFFALFLCIRQVAECAKNTQNHIVLISKNIRQ